MLSVNVTVAGIYHYMPLSNIATVSEVCYNEKSGMYKHAQ